MATEIWMFQNGSITSPVVAWNFNASPSRKYSGLLNSRYLTVEGGGLVTET